MIIDNYPLALYPTYEKTNVVCAPFQEFTSLLPSLTLIYILRPDYFLEVLGDGVDTRSLG